MFAIELGVVKEGRILIAVSSIVEVGTIEDAGSNTPIP